VRIQDIPLNKPTSVLRLNVGFLLREQAGYSREIPIDEPEAVIADDLMVRRLHGVITLTRTPQGLYAQGRLRASAPGECVRCLTHFEQPVTSRFVEMYHYPPEKAPAEALVIPEHMNLDFAPVVREDMLLAMPMRQLCRPDCKGLCPICGQNWNEGVCACEPEAGEGGLGALKQLKDKLP
jgi:uncharacterized protein